MEFAPIWGENPLSSLPRHNLFRNMPQCDTSLRKFTPNRYRSGVLRDGLLGIVGFAVLYFLRAQQWDLATGILAVVVTRGLLPFAHIIVGAALLGGVFGVLIMMIRYILLSWKLRRADVSSTTTAEKTIDKAFRGAAEKILQEPENNIPIPRYVDHKHLAYAIKTRTNGTFDRRQRLVLAVANSVEEMKKRVPRDWLTAVQEELEPVTQQDTGRTKSESALTDESPSESIFECPTCSMFLHRKVAQCPYCGASIDE